MTTQRIILFLFLLVGLTACDKIFKKKSIINGVVQNCNNCTVYLKYYDYAQMEELSLKTIKVQEGKFSFVIDQDSMPRPGVYAVTMELNEENLYRHKSLKAISPHIYLPADTVNLIMNPAGLPQKKSYPYPNSSSSLSLADIKSTSSEQSELNFYLRMRDSMDVKFDNYKNLRTAFFNQAIESGNKQEVDKWADTLNNFFAVGGQYRPKAADVFIRKYPNSKLATYALLDNHGYMSAAPRFRKYYQAMSQEQQTSYDGQVLDKRLASWERRNTKFAQHIIGAEITYLTGRTPQGDTLQESNIFKKNKLTLVDFWASWCDSCRLRTPAYRQLYKTYQGKGFEIISVSLDVNAGDWQKAIRQDQMNWYQISDLKENNGDIKRFRLRGIPANILMNQEGKIVAADVTPEQLQAKLKEQL